MRGWGAGGEVDGVGDGREQERSPWRWEGRERAEGKGLPRSRLAYERQTSSVENWSIEIWETPPEMIFEKRRARECSRSTAWLSFAMIWWRAPRE